MDRVKFEHPFFKALKIKGNRKQSLGPLYKLGI